MLKAVAGLTKAVQLPHTNGLRAGMARVVEAIQA
jgi:hypothetical protein